jgi:hypothetical protein
MTVLIDDMKYLCRRKREKMTQCLAKELIRLVFISFESALNYGFILFGCTIRQVKRVR